METMKAIIVDDEPDARRSLKKDIKENFPEIEVVSLAGDSSQALDAIGKYRPDLVFLDVEMPGKSGLELAHDLKRQDINTAIIFTTAFDQYAIQAIRYAAFDYLLKPVDMSELKAVVERFKTEKNGYSLKSKLERLTTWLSPDRVYFETESGYVLIRPADIVFCEALGKTTRIALANGRREMINLELKKVEASLPSHIIVRINRTALINLNFLVKVDNVTRTVYLENMLVEYEFTATSRGLSRLKQ